MSKRIDDVISDVKEIKRAQVETVIRLTEYNALLDVHIKGVQGLDARVKPLEEHVNFIRNIIKSSVWLFSAVGATCAVLRFLW